MLFHFFATNETYTHIWSWSIVVSCFYSILHVHNGLEMVTQQEYIREKPTVHSMRVLE